MAQVNNQRRIGLYIHKMLRRRGTAILAILLGLIFGFTPIVVYTAQGSGNSQSGETIFALANSNRLLQFNSATTCQVDEKRITGLQNDETLLGIDFRPLNGQLYGLGSSNRLYVIDPQSGAASAVGAQPFSVTLSGQAFGFDFNPTVDRIRVVSDAGQNLRLHPDTGALVAVDGTLVYSTTDVNAGRQPRVTAAAYTNNDNDPNTGTTLYDIDAANDTLVTQTPPNSGTLVTVGSFGANIGRMSGFDISPSGVAYAVVQAPNQGQTCGNHRLVTVDLATGAVTNLGAIGTERPVVGLAVSTQ